MSQAVSSKFSSCCWRTLASDLRSQLQPRRSLVTIQRGRVPKLDLPENIPQQFWSQLPNRLRPDKGKREIIIHPAPVSEREACKDPVAVIDAQSKALLDPTGARARLFESSNKDRAKVGDVLLTTFKSGEPFSGVIMSIKSRGPHTSVLLRNQLTRIGTEMLVKIHSPLVQSMEVAQRAVKRKRRARLYYLRQPKHDVGSVQKVVDQYLRQRSLLTGGKGATRYGGAAQSRKGKR